MRIIGSLALTVAILFMVGCASHINKEVSQDYTATGFTGGVSAYVYANHTVIEFDQEPSLAWVAPPIISITNEDNQAIGYERLGRFCRLDRQYDYFKLRVNGRLTALFLNNYTQKPTLPFSYLNRVQQNFVREYQEFWMP